MNKKQEQEIIYPKNLVGLIPVVFGVSLLLLVIWGLYHVYFRYTGEITFGGESLNDSEKMQLTKQVSVKGEEAVSEKYKFVKRIRVREDDKAIDRQNNQKFFVWESLHGFNADISKISKNIETLFCKSKKGDDWSDDKTREVNAWCSLIGSTYEAVTAKALIRRVVNKNKGTVMKKKNKDKTEEYKFVEGNNELFELPPYDFLKGLRGFDVSENKSKISNNGEYTLSIYPSVQEKMFQFMSDNNMVGSVFAYRPSNGDIYCMASTPGWSEREYKYNGDKVFRKGKDGYYYADRGEKEELPKDGAQMNKNLYSFTPGSTMKPLTLLVLKDQGKNLDNLKFTVTGDDKGWVKGDSYYLKHGDNMAIHCSMHHDNKEEQSASDGLGNSCNSFFAKSAEELDLKKAKKTLEDMGFFVEEYEGDPKESTVDEIKKRYTRSIDNIPYNQNALPLEKTMEHSRRNVINFIGEGNLLVSPIDMAVFTALFGKLSKDKNSKVYFPRIWLPADETKRKEGFPELLLTGNNLKKNGDENSTEKEYVGQIEKEHIAKLSEFVSTRKDAIVEVGKIWKTAYNEHYRENNQKWPSFRHLDKYEKYRRYGLTRWSQWIDMAKTGTVDERPDETDPKYGCPNQKYSYNLEKERYECVNKLNRAEHRTQRTLSLYSEELDLAAYIVIENYDGVYAGNSKIKLDATSMMLTRLVAEALGKELDDTKPSGNEKSKKEKEEEQWKNLGKIPGINCSTCPKKEQR